MVTEWRAIARHPGRSSWRCLRGRLPHMSGSIPPNLIASLVFGVGQIVVGGGLAWFELAPRKWRDWRAVLAGAAGVWFFVSGVSELIVSGMEVSRLSGGGPD